MTGRISTILEHSRRLTRWQHRHALRSGGEAALLDAVTALTGMAVVAVVMAGARQGRIDPAWSLAALVVCLLYTSRCV